MRGTVRRACLVLCGIVAAALVAACRGDSADPEADAPDTSEATAAKHSAQRAGLPHSGAPNVTTPVADTTRAEREPCSLLTARTLAMLDFDPFRVTPSHDNGGPGCTYSQLSTIEVRTTLGTQLPDGLSGLYAEKAEFDLFKPAHPLQGHPAVIADIDDRRAEGRCAVFVGIRDDLTFRTIVEADPKTHAGRHPCKFGADVTVLALHTMQRHQR
jgi:hypothetical protein